MTGSEIEALAEAASSALDSGDSALAVETITHAKGLLASLESPAPLLLARVAGLLVDVGARASSGTMVEDGLDLYLGHRESVVEVISEPTLEYNLGNGKSALHDIRLSSGGVRFSPENVSLLTEAKNHYWRGMKLVGREQCAPEQLVNLGNALDSSGRLVEALRWYDAALRIDPGFGMAHLNRGRALLFLPTLSDSFSIELLTEAFRAFESARADSRLPEDLQAEAADRAEKTIRRLGELGWAADRVSRPDPREAEEERAHSAFRRFCIDEWIALCEHALYCRCAGSRRDDLSIVKQSGPIGGEFVPRLELLLNRLKSEFSLARALYWQASHPKGGRWVSDDYEATFTELIDGEAIGLTSEWLRTSFRLCFGILDRIATVLNELFGFAKPGENLYFESFWRPRRKSGDDEARWRQINEVNNIPLVALYSLATDLNAATDGEWGFFKTTRNALEHGHLVVLHDPGKGLPDWVKATRIQQESTTESQFRSHTLELLRFTASAIFSFAFCVRHEGLRVAAPGALQVTFDKKRIGPP